MGPDKNYFNGKIAKLTWRPVKKLKIHEWKNVDICGVIAFCAFQNVPPSTMAVAWCQTCEFAFRDEVT